MYVLHGVLGIVTQYVGESQIEFGYSVGLLGMGFYVIRSGC